MSDHDSVMLGLEEFFGCIFGMLVWGFGFGILGFIAIVISGYFGWFGIEYIPND